MIWREKRVLLILLALVLAANTMFFFTYRVQYQSRLDTLDERLAQVEGELDQARTARIKAEQTLQSYRKVENDVLQVFNEHWSTQQAAIHGALFGGHAAGRRQRPGPRVVFIQARRRQADLHRRSASDISGPVK